MTNINEVYSEFLAAEDLNGLPMLVTIRQTEIKTFDDGTKKGCIFFNEEQRGVRLNVTNKNVLVEMFGAETDNWVGQSIEIFPSTTDYQGKTVACIRLRRPVLQQPVPQAMPQPVQPVTNVQQPVPQAMPQPVQPVTNVQQPAQQYSNANPPPHPGTNPNR